ncbi:MAG: TIGR04076 family protein [Lachnospiraceae bacterium]|nr:TIGR04076 family protein [Lachnospiraceae bacterium]
MKGETLKKVKISVIEVTFSEERAKRYAPEGYGKCELHDVGQVFYSNGWQKPSGLCDNAWNCMRDYVLAISQGAGFIYGDGGFTNQEGMVIVACNDGIRPVIFKVESTDMESDTFNEDLTTVKSLHKDPSNTSTK